MAEPLEVVLRADGLEVGADATAQRLQLARTPQDEVTKALQDALGTPGQASDLPDCGQGPRSAVRFEGLSVLFDGDTFVGWTDEGSPERNSTTPEGLGIQSSLADLRSVLPGVQVSSVEPRRGVGGAGRRRLLRAARRHGRDQQRDLAVRRRDLRVPVTVLGTVVRLQVQRSPLKPGPAGERVYDPSPLLEVPSLEVGPRGVRGLLPDGPVLDAHHADHPQTRNVRLVNGLSVLPRAHYDALRARFGPQVVDGSAGESLLLDTDGPLTEDDLRGPLLLDAVDGDPLPLELVAAAPPCVEFSRWCLGRGVGEVDDEVKAALAWLGDGRRGFYLRTEGTARITRGARLVRL